MATTTFQQKLANEVFLKLQEMDAANEFEPRQYSRILYPLLAREGVLREAWPYNWRSIKGLVQGRIYRLNQARMREFARNTRREAANLAEYSKTEEFWIEFQAMQEEANLHTHPID